jgi:hypothetical protein
MTNEIEKTVPEWNKNQFLAFVLLYGANFDMEYSPEEKQIIHSLLDKDHYLEVRDKFRSLNDSQCIDLITSFKGLYFPTPELTEELLHELDVLLQSDGNYKNIENGCRSMLHRLL